MNNLNSLKDRIKNKKNTLLIFDYDGTLTPIVDNPSLAKLTTEVKKALENLSKLDFIKIGIVTGRSIADFKILSSIDTSNIIIFGMHGGEFELNKQIISLLTNNERLSVIESFAKDLNTECADYEGIIIEDKGYSVALHYRLADEITAQKAKDIFNKMVATLNKPDSFKVQVGKKVLEFMPIGFSKDKAVYGLIEANSNYIPYYFGDDITDIIAFKEVRKNGGYAVGINPHPVFPETVLDFEVTQSELEQFIIQMSNNYGEI
jgi:trehalose 6-phosphate phosphatase